MLTNDQEWPEVILEDALDADLVVPSITFPFRVCEWGPITEVFVVYIDGKRVWPVDNAD
jgi:hypothetical protein